MNIWRSGVYIRSFPQLFFMLFLRYGSHQAWNQTDLFGLHGCPVSSSEPPMSTFPMLGLHTLPAVPTTGNSHLGHVCTASAVATSTSSQPQFSLSKGGNWSNGHNTQQSRSVLLLASHTNQTAFFYEKNGSRHSTETDINRKEWASEARYPNKDFYSLLLVYIYTTIHFSIFFLSLSKMKFLMGR